MTARLAPIWNAVGNEYFVNNRDFLVAKGPQEGIRYHILVKGKAVKGEEIPKHIYLTSILK